MCEKSPFSFHYKFTFADKMLTKEKIPVLEICNMVDATSVPQEVLVFELDMFLQSHQNMVFPHRHSFYQVLFIESGVGFHIIDFKKFEVRKNIVYFLTPGQVHEWQFSPGTKGLLINFTEAFFSLYLSNFHYLKNFPFFLANGSHAVLDIQSVEHKIKPLLQDIRDEYFHQPVKHLNMLRLLLLQLFEWMNRQIDATEETEMIKPGMHIMRKFYLLIEEHYTNKHLPKEYAAMLFITPNYLNELCVLHTGHSAGEHIRNRILLEAKRLLVNSSLSISEIAWSLHFENHSYFSRFFKKYCAVTPEAFRKQVA